jgi:hypothetical protein
MINLTIRERIERAVFLMAIIVILLDVFLWRP